MLIYIEGNIGAGKTTFLSLLNKYMETIDTKLKCKSSLIYEPVNEWINTRDSDGKNILQKFYDDQPRWAFTFQMNSFISRVDKIMDKMSNDYRDDNGEKMKNILFVERSIYTDRYCFAENCYESGNMTKMEYDIYCKWNEWLGKEFSVRPTMYIYLKANPNVCNERIIERSRSEENNIPLEYLKTLHDKHETWLSRESDTIPIFTIDATQNLKDQVVMETVFNDLLNFLEKKTF